MPPRPESKESLRPYHSQIEGAIKNALSVALGGDIDPKDLVLDARDLQKIEEDIAADGEEAAGVNKRPNTRTSREKTISRFGQRPNAEPAGGGMSDLNSQVNAGSSIPAEMRPGSADAGGSNTNNPQNGEDEVEDDSSPDDEEDTADDDDGEEAKKSETKPEPVSPAEARQAAEKKEMDDFLNKTDASFKRCPYDGQILNQDGSCPAGDHSSLGGTPQKSNQAKPASQPGVGANPNPNRPVPAGQTNQASSGQSSQAGQPMGGPVGPSGYPRPNRRQPKNKKAEELKEKIKQEKAKLVKLEKKLAKLDSLIKILNRCALFTYATIILFFIGLALQACAWLLFVKRLQVKFKIAKTKLSIKQKEAELQKLTKVRHNFDPASSPYFRIRPPNYPPQNQPTQSGNSGGSPSTGSK